jgi:hypothetical protein
MQTLPASGRLLSRTPVRRTVAVTASCALLAACGSGSEPGPGESVRHTQAAVTVDCSKIDQVQTSIDAKKILTVAKDVADLYSNSEDLSKPIQLAADLLDLGSPSVDDQFQALRAELECLTQALDWKMEALDYNTNQWAPVSAAWMEAQSVGFTRGSDYDVSSHDAVVASGGLVMFERLYRSSATDGAWKSIITNNQPDIIDVNQVFDWRMAFPQFARLVAMRLAMIVMMDPQFASDGLWNPELDGTDAVPGYRRVLQARLQQMTASVRCDTKDRLSYYNGHITSYTETDIACADVNTGVSATSEYVIPNVSSCATTFGDARVPYSGLDATCFANLPGHATAVSMMDPLRRQVLSEMPIFEVQSMIDTLFLLTHPALDLTEAFGRIPVLTNPGLCLDVQWGNSASGTPVWIWDCTGSVAQQWSYNRQTQTITNTAFGKCLQVRQNVFSFFGFTLSLDNDTPGAIAEISDCVSPPPLRQQWSYDPQGSVIHNALGTVLDIQWDNQQPETPVWLWDYNGGTAQQWLADQ